MTFKQFLKAFCNKQYTAFFQIDRVVAEIMIELYGFKKVEYEQKAIVYGCAKIVDPDRREDGDEYEILLDRIKEKFWKRKEG